MPGSNEPKNESKNESKSQPAEPAKTSHTLADHTYGIDLAHTHDGYADHDHDFPDELPLEENPIWIADHVSLMTVGIDIGSSGTQVIFSRVNLRRLGEELTSRYPGLTLAGTPVRRPLLVLRGFESVPVRAA